MLPGNAGLLHAGHDDRQVVIRERREKKKRNRSIGFPRERCTQYTLEWSTRVPSERVVGATSRLSDGDEGTLVHGAGEARFPINLFFNGKRRDRESCNLELTLVFV